MQMQKLKNYLLLCIKCQKIKERTDIMLKIREDVDLKELEKYGFIHLDEIHKCIVDKEVLDGCNNILTLANNKSQNEVKEILARAEKIAVYELPEN